MLKKITVAVLAAVLLAAGAFSLYNVVFAQTATTAEADGVAVAAGDAVPSNSTPPQTPPATPPATTQQQQRQGQTQPQDQVQGQMQQQGMPQVQGRGQRPGQVQMQNQAAGATQQRGNTNMNSAAPQSNLGEWQTLSGTVREYLAPNFVLVTEDGQQIAAQLGNLSYVNKIGLQLAEGQSVTVAGATDSSGGFAIKAITVDGNTYNLRDENGRPLWAGRGNK